MQALQVARFTRSTLHHDDEPCRNCDVVFCGNYCPNCGQEACTGAPTTIGFIYEFLTRNVFERGKLGRTLWHLVRHPGGLTVDFLEGRRQRSIRPVRLYIGLSVLFFLTLSLSGAIERKLDKVTAINDKAADTFHAPKNAKDNVASELAATPAPPATPGHPGLKKRRIGAAEDESAPDADLRALDQILPASTAKVLKKRIQRVIGMSDEERTQELLHGTLNHASKAMFFLVPVFAFLLKCVFVLRRIPYGAHLLFAFHYHSFIFVCLLAMLLPIPAEWTGWAVLPICLYLPLAMRTTYGVGWLGAILRCFVLSIFYLIAVVLALVGAVAAAVLL